MQITHSPSTTDNPIPPRTVSAIAVVDLARQLRAIDPSLPDTLAGVWPELTRWVERMETGQDLAELLHRRFPEHWLRQLWQSATNALPKDLGFRIGQWVNPQAQGLLASWISHCDTLGEALALYVEKIELLNERDGWTIQPRNSDVCLQSRLGDEVDYPQQAKERSLVALIAWGRYLTDETLAPTAVYWTHARPDHDEALTQFFECPQYFGQAANSLVFPNAALQRPLKQANAYVKKLMGRHINDVSFHTHQPLTSQIRTLLQQDLKRFSQVEAVCDCLHLSRATLYRKLRDEGQVYSSLLDEERQRQAGRLYAHAVADIADRLGYQDISSFYKARKRWQQGRAVGAKVR